MKGLSTPKHCLRVAIVLCRYEGLVHGLLLDWYLGSQKLREILTLPGSILIISISITLFTLFLLCLLLFTLHISIKNTKNIISIGSHSRKWPWRDWQPLITLVARSYLFCVGTWDSCVASYLIDTLVLKNWGKYLRYFAASPFPLQGKTNAVLKR